MKSTGIVRKLDELGRITLPIELRRTLGVEERDARLFRNFFTAVIKQFVFCTIKDICWFVLFQDDSVLLNKNFEGISLLNTKSSS